MTRTAPPSVRLAAPSRASGYTVATMEQPVELVGRALVVVVDDRSAHGEEDHSGPLVTELLTEAGFVVDGVVVVAADEIEIRNALNTAVIGGVDLVVSVGGTGVTPRDVTPGGHRRDPRPRTAGHRRGAARLRVVGRDHRRGPVPRPGRRFRQHPGGEHRRLARTRYGTAWRRSTRWRHRSSASCPAWRSDRSRTASGRRPGRRRISVKLANLGAPCRVKRDVNCRNEQNVIFVTSRGTVRHPTESEPAPS